MRKEFDFNISKLSPEQVEHLKLHSLYKLAEVKSVVAFQRAEAQRGRLAMLCSTCQEIAKALGI